MSTTDNVSAEEQGDGRAATPADKASNTGRSAQDPAEGGDDVAEPGEGSPRG